MYPNKKHRNTVNLQKFSFPFLARCFFEEKTLKNKNSYFGSNKLKNTHMFYKFIF